jgi:hypothetical protein
MKKLSIHGKVGDDYCNEIILDIEAIGQEVTVVTDVRDVAHFFVDIAQLAVYPTEVI